MVRDGGAGQGGGLGDLPDIEPLALLKEQQHALAVLVAQGGEHLGHATPFGGEGLGVVGFHVDDLSCIDVFGQRWGNAARLVRSLS